MSEEPEKEFPIIRAFLESEDLITKGEG